MTMSEAIVFVVDDDAAIRKSLARLIKSVGLQVVTFSSAAEFLQSDPYDGPSCLLLDVRMPGVSGLDLQKQLATMGINLPIIFLTGHGNVPMSVKAMKTGALDFLEKPVDDQTLLDVIYQAIEKDRGLKLKQAELREIQQRTDSLTPREREVFALVVTGMLNKEIAFELKTSEKTIKVHRARVMQKMQAKSLADLVRLAEKTGLYKP
jgi:FixJ family two-component response regulator